MFLTGESHTLGGGGGGGISHLFYSIWSYAWFSGCYLKKAGQFIVNGPIHSK